MAEKYWSELDEKTSMAAAISERLLEKVWKEGMRPGVEVGFGFVNRYSSSKLSSEAVLEKKPLTKDELKGMLYNWAVEKVRKGDIKKGMDDAKLLRMVSSSMQPITKGTVEEPRKLDIASNITAGIPLTSSKSADMSIGADASIREKYGKTYYISGTYNEELSSAYKYERLEAGYGGSYIRGDFTQLKLDSVGLGVHSGALDITAPVYDLKTRKLGVIAGIDVGVAGAGYNFAEKSWTTGVNYFGAAIGMGMEMYRDISKKYKSEGADALLNILNPVTIVKAAWNTLIVNPINSISNTIHRFFITPSDPKDKATKQFTIQELYESMKSIREDIDNGWIDRAEDKVATMLKYEHLPGYFKGYLMATSDLIKMRKAYTGLPFHFFSIKNFLRSKKSVAKEEIDASTQESMKRVEELAGKKGRLSDKEFGELESHIVYLGMKLAISEGTELSPLASDKEKVIEAYVKGIEAYYPKAYENARYLDKMYENEKVKIDDAELRKVNDIGNFASSIISISALSGIVNPKLRKETENISSAGTELANEALKKPRLEGMSMLEMMMISDGQAKILSVLNSSTSLDTLIETYAQNIDIFRDRGTGQYTKYPHIREAYKKAISERIAKDKEGAKKSFGIAVKQLERAYVDYANTMDDAKTIQDMEGVPIAAEARNAYNLVTAYVEFKKELGLDEKKLEESFVWVSAIGTLDMLKFREEIPSNLQSTKEALKKIDSRRSRKLLKYIEKYEKQLEEKRKKGVTLGEARTLETYIESKSKKQILGYIDHLLEKYSKIDKKTVAVLKDVRNMAKEGETRKEMLEYYRNNMETLRANGTPS